MKTKHVRTLFASRATAALAAVALASAVQAQTKLATTMAALHYYGARQSEDVSQKLIPSLELEQADVREALRALFKDVGVSYSIAPEVQGSVTVSLKNVTFATALQNVLRQLDATYRVEGGVYEIIKRVDTVAPVPEGRGPAPTSSSLIVKRIKIRSADPAFIAAMIGSKGGSQNYTTASPERSTIAKTPSGGGSGSGGGMGGSGSGSGSGGFGGGTTGGGSGGTGSGFGSGSSGRTG